MRLLSSLSPPLCLSLLFFGLLIFANPRWDSLLRFRLPPVRAVPRLFIRLHVGIPITAVWLVGLSVRELRGLVRSLQSEGTSAEAFFSRPTRHSGPSFRRLSRWTNSHVLLALLVLLRESDDPRSVSPPCASWYRSPSLAESAPLDPSLLSYCFRRNVGAVARVDPLSAPFPVACDLSHHQLLPSVHLLNSFLPPPFLPVPAAPAFPR